MNKEIVSIEIDYLKSKLQNAEKILENIRKLMQKHPEDITLSIDETQWISIVKELKEKINILEKKGR